MIEAVVLTTGWLFWIGLGLLIAFDVFALSTEDEGLGGWAIFLTMASLVVMFAFTDAFVGIKLMWAIYFVIGYCFLGVIWSFKKWVDFIKDRKKVVGSTSKPPKASEHKARIVTSMAMWPFQFTWWVLTWPRHFFVWAYDRLATVYDRIATSIWEKV